MKETFDYQTLPCTFSFERLDCKTIYILPTLTYHKVHEKVEGILFESADSFDQLLNSAELFIFHLLLHCERLQGNIIGLCPFQA